MTTETRNGSDSRRALLNVPIGDIYASGTNPRKRFDDAALGELAESVRLQGVLEPLLVRVRATKDGKPRGLGEKELYEIIAGERRWRAAKLAKRAEVPCVVCEATDDQAADMQLAENIQRAELSPLEEAHALAAALERQKKANHFATAGVGDGLSAKEVKSRDEKLDSAAESVGRKIGKSAKYVYDRIKLLELVPEVAKALAEEKITAGHAIELARIDEKAQARVFERVKPTSWRPEPAPVREVREQVKADARRQLSAKRRREEEKKRRKNPAAEAKAESRQDEWQEEQRRHELEQKVIQRMFVVVLQRAFKSGISGLEWKWLFEEANRQIEDGEGELVAEALGLNGRQRNRRGVARLSADATHVVRVFFAAQLMGNADYGFGREEKALINARLTSAEQAAIRKEIEGRAKPKKVLQTAAKTAGNEAPAVGKSAGKRNAKAGRKAGKRAPAERVSRAKKGKK